MDGPRKLGNNSPPISKSTSSSNTQGMATLIVMLAVLIIIILFCCFAAPGVRMMCKRYVFRRCMGNDPNIDNDSRTEEACTPTVILLPNGRMLVVDRSILRSEFELMEISADLISARRQLGSSSSILESGEASKGISPTSLGVPPPTYEDVFPDFPPSYSEISLMLKNEKSNKYRTRDDDDDDGIVNSVSDNNCVVQRDSYN